MLHVYRTLNERSCQVLKLKDHQNKHPMQKKVETAATHWRHTVRQQICDL